MRLNSRSGVQKDDTIGNDDDYVELEKSNVLLIGPTGSGIFSIFTKTCQFAFIVIIMIIQISERLLLTIILIFVFLP